MKKLLLLSLLVSMAVGCVKATPPLPVEQRIAQAPQQGQVTLASRAAEQIGDIVPIDVNIANGTDARVHLDPTQVFAITPEGKRVAPIPTSDAIRLSGDATSLGASLKSGVITGLAGAALGAAAGAAMGSTGGHSGSGAIIGGTLGGVAGTVGGGASGSQSASEVSSAQIRTYALQDRDVEPGYSINGYVFYPPGTYTAVEAAVGGEEGEPQRLRAEMGQNVSTGTD
jgi:hypothetical protein